MQISVRLSNEVIIVGIYGITPVECHSEMVNRRMFHILPIIPE